MGRPVNPKFLGDPDSAGFQITGIVDVGSGVEGCSILRQRSNNRYLVEGNDSSVQRVCKLVNGVPAAVGEMSISIYSDLLKLIVSQDETDFDGTGDNGTFVAGTGYAVSDDITLSNNAVVTVDGITPDKQLIASPIQDETDFDGTGDNGTFVAGTGYTGGDTLTLSNGDIVTVGTVGGSGEVTGFTVTTVNGISVAGTELEEVAGGPGNDDFTLTPGTANLEDASTGDVTEFTIGVVGGDFTVDDLPLTQSSTDGGGTGFTLTPGDDNDARVVIHYARNINNRTVKTFDGNVFSWPINTNVTERVKVDLEGE